MLNLLQVTVFTYERHAKIALAIVVIAIIAVVIIGRKKGWFRSSGRR